MQVSSDKWIVGKINELEKQKDDLEDTLDFLRKELQRRKGVSEDKESNQQLLQE
jgi:hypothetical protein